MPDITLGGGYSVSVELPVTPDVEAAVIYATGPPGPPGPPGNGSGGGGGGSAALVHNQTTPLATWTIPHTLGRRPVVAVYVAGAEVIADVEATVTTVVIVHLSPATGQAVLT